MTARRIRRDEEREVALENLVSACAGLLRLKLRGE